MKFKKNICDAARIAAASAVLIAALIALNACGAKDAIDATASMPDKMDGMKKSMGVTNEAIHKQTLVVALDNMLKEENSSHLNPPTGMFPGGEAFANEATTEELAKLTYVFSREIAELTPNDGQALKDAAGAWTPYAVKFDHNKSAKLTAMMVIAGLTPQAKVEQMVQDQVVQRGRFQPYAYYFLTLRALFIKVYLVEQGLLAYKLTNFGMLVDANKYVDQVEYVARLNFADKLEIKTTGFLNQDLNVHFVVKGGDDNTNIFGSDRTPVGLWRSLQRAFDNDLDPEYKKENKSLDRDIRADLDALKQHFDDEVKSWSVSK